MFRRTFFLTAACASLLGAADLQFVTTDGKAESVAKHRGKPVAVYVMNPG
jgi:hypothetical protein